MRLIPAELLSFVSDVADDPFSQRYVIGIYYHFRAQEILCPVPHELRDLCRTLDRRINAVI